MEWTKLDELLGRVQCKTTFPNKAGVHEWLNHLNLRYEWNEKENSITAWLNDDGMKMQKYLLLVMPVDKGYFIGEVYKQI